MLGFNFGIGTLRRLIVNDVSLGLSVNLDSVSVCYVLWVARWD